MKTSDPPPRKSFVSRIPPLGRSGSSEFKHVSESKAVNLFCKYKDANEDAILSSGIEKLCLDLELKPEEFKVAITHVRIHLATLLPLFSSDRFLSSHGSAMLSKCASSPGQSSCPAVEP